VTTLGTIRNLFDELRTRMSTIEANVLLIPQILHSMNHPVQNVDAPNTPNSGLTDELLAALRGLSRVQASQCRQLARIEKLLEPPRHKDDWRTHVPCTRCGGTPVVSCNTTTGEYLCDTCAGCNPGTGPQWRKDENPNSSVLKSYFPTTPIQVDRLEKALLLLLERSDPYRNSIYCPPVPFGLARDSGSPPEPGSSKTP